MNTTFERRSKRRRSKNCRPLLEQLESRLPVSDTVVGVFTALAVYELGRMAWEPIWEDVGISPRLSPLQVGDEESAAVAALSPDQVEIAVPIHSESPDIATTAEDPQVAYSDLVDARMYRRLENVALPHRANGSSGIAVAFETLNSATYSRGGMNITVGASSGVRSPMAGLIRPRQQASAQTVSPKTMVAADSARLPLRFEPNHGQTDSQVDFLARGNGYTLFLTPDEAVMSLHQADVSAVVRMQLLDADPAAMPVASQRLAGTANYYRGSDPSEWYAGINTFGRVEYHNTYPGIDLAYYSNAGELEYDFIVSPGADPADIQLNFEGARNASINPSGDLILETAAGDIVQPRPILYQEVDGARQEVAGEFRIQNSKPGSYSSIVTFDVGPYDTGRLLIIDPKVQYRFLLGGSFNDETFAISMNASAKPTVTGFTDSPDFPTAGNGDPSYNGQRDAFVTQLTADGTDILYSTYLGGSHLDEGRGVSVDSQGNTVVTGFTESIDFPAVSPIQPNLSGVRDAFVTKLNPTGAVTFSTFLGGNGMEEGRGIAAGVNGEVAVTGITSTTSGPVFQINPVPGGYGGGNSDAFATKYRLQAGGNAVVFSTYLGGAQNENVGFNALGGGTTIDNAGIVYVTGATKSFDFDITPDAFQIFVQGPQDAFVSKIAPVGFNLIYSTYLGGDGTEEGNGIGIDQVQNMYVAGATNSNNFDITPGAFQNTLNGVRDAFVTQFGQMGNPLNYSTYLGGDEVEIGEIGHGIAVSPAGNAFVTGLTTSHNFPTRNPVQPEFGGGQSDAFVTKFLPEGNVKYSTYFGNVATEFARGIAWAADPGRGGQCGRGGLRDDPCDMAAITGPTSEEPPGGAFVAGIAECPCTPSGLTATPKPGGIVLSWVDYCPEYTTKFYIHWWIEGDPDEQPPIEVTPTSPPLVFHHGGLDPTKTYYFKIISENSCCESGYSNTVSSTPFPRAVGVGSSATDTPPPSSIP